MTLEFVGPLGVAFAASRGRLDLLWAGLAGAGIVLLSPLPGGDLDSLGCALALLAGGFWAAYIVLAERSGAASPVARAWRWRWSSRRALLLPIGIADGGRGAARPGLLAVGLAVAILSSAIPYSLELEALRRLPRGTFGVLMSLEPAVAATIGFVGLDQGLAASEVLAIALVVTASAGALRTAPPPVEA